MYPWRCVWFLSAMVATAFPSPPFPPPQPLVSSCSCTTLNVNQTSGAGGDIEGEILMYFTKGSLDRPLYLSCEFFKDTILLKINDQCITEMNGWVEKHTGVSDSGHPVKLQVNFKGKSDQVQDEEEGEVRSASQDVVKCAANRVVSQPADCLPIPQDDSNQGEVLYLNCLKRFQRLLQPGKDIIFFVE